MVVVQYNRFQQSSLQTFLLHCFLKCIAYLGLLWEKKLLFLSGLLFTAAAVVKGKTAFKAKKKKKT